MEVLAGLGSPDGGSSGTPLGAAHPGSNQSLEIRLDLRTWIARVSSVWLLDGWVEALPSYHQTSILTIATTQHMQTSPVFAHQRRECWAYDSQAAERELHESP